VMHFLKAEAKGTTTRVQKIMRQLVAPPAETMKPIIHCPHPQRGLVER